MDANLSLRLDLFSELISCGQNLSYWELDPDLQIVRTTCENAQLFHAFFLMDGGSIETSDAIHPELNRPMVYTNSIGMSWLCCGEISVGNLCRVHLVGPAFNSDFSYHTLESLLAKKKYPRDMIEQFMSHIQELPTVPLDMWMRYALMLHFCITGQKLEISDLQYQDLSATITAKNSANELPYPKDGTWYAEQMVIKMVEEGQINYKKARMGLSNSGGVEIMTGTPALRKMKNYLISLNSLITRAAIRGGLDAPTAYHLGEIYMDAIESAPSISALMQMSNTMLDDFIQRVHKVRSASGISQAVQSCCGYIDMHLSEKITMQTLAAQVGYAEYYLAQKFKKETGMTVAQYIKNRRVEQGKILLKSSNQNIAAIAESLGFCNSSHFSDAFRSITGMSPVEYREH